MLGSSSKRSRETSSLKSFSSINPNPNVYVQFMDRLRELFGNGPNKRLTKAYADAASLHYGKDEIACCTFLAYEDDDAKAVFASKTNIDIQM
ncbi:hypothetical protein A2U01_0011849 [Trifolium medium]|uniref:Uncharacterized protein n=1 Tax=Trifolium medium TaxID=97028 RepID=A0A392MTP6_9FABA|nr:hypothetical protein [Trifolium medium]